MRSLWDECSHILPFLEGCGDKGLGVYAEQAGESTTNSRKPGSTIKEEKPTKTMEINLRRVQFPIQSTI